MTSRILSLIIAYLLGSIPVGYLLVKYVFTEGADVRSVGSGATGATNVSRLAGLKGGLLTGVFDVGKGTLAVLIAGWLSQNDLWWMGTAGIVAMLGHIFPVWIGFRGGKGVATGVGAYMLLSPFSVFSALLLWLLVVAWKRYVALGSILAAASVPLWVLLWDRQIFPRSPEQLTALVVATLVGSIVIIAAHHENIERLLKGTEDKIGQRHEPAARSES